MRLIPILTVHEMLELGSVHIISSAKLTSNEFNENPRKTNEEIVGDASSRIVKNLNYYRKIVTVCFCVQLFCVRKI